MADEAKTITVAKTVVEALTDDAHAPFVFFDGVGPRGHMHNLIFITVTAMRQLPAVNGTDISAVPTVVAHLRTNIPGATFLRDALDEALTMAAMQSPQGGVRTRN